MLSGNLLWVLCGTMLLGIAAGITGTFSFLQKQSLVGDAAAHAALPGIALAFLLTGQKELPILMLGAGITSALSVYCIQWIVSFSKLKADAAIGLVLTVFLTVVNRSPLGNQSGLNNFIFGKAATMTKADLMWLFISATIIILVSLLLYKEWKLLIFDPVYAKGIGLPIEALKATLTVLIVMTIVTGIQAVGVILMSALLIIPAASAKLWTKKLSSMLMLSAIIGGVSGITGTFISAMRTGLSTGPIIVLVAAAIFFLSYFISPSGQISKFRRKMQFRKQGELG
ncbi:metal ABC transporter permease [Lysinibacillus pakistanensis]|uniref:metal ABC transporter permease n=2 Tax=Lysinibacillus TaxID=400634 RepID=UPI0028ACC17F|nr:metal ABC transporter permease [Lysinibacillus pakistanensis]